MNRGESAQYRILTQMSPYSRSKPEELEGARSCPVTMTISAMPVYGGHVLPRLRHESFPVTDHGRYGSFRIV